MTAVSARRIGGWVVVVALGVTGAAGCSGAGAPPQGPRVASSEESTHGSLTPPGVESPGPTEPAPSTRTPRRKGAEPVEVVDNQLEWEEVDRFSVGESPLVLPPLGGRWQVEINAPATRATITRRGGSAMVLTHQAQPRAVIEDLLLRPPWLLVVEDTGEGSPARGTWYRLDTGASTVLNEKPGLPEPAEDGKWTLYEHRLVYPYYPRQGRFCVVDADLVTMRGRVVYCVYGRNGINEQMVTPAGLAWARFDNRRPSSCATPMVLPDGATSARVIKAAEPCKAWDVALAAPDVPVWSQVIRQRTIDESELYSHVDGRLLSLGSILTGSLTWCAGAVYWTTVRGDIRRWTPGGPVEVVYSKPPGQVPGSTLPVCGGDTIVFETRHGTFNTPPSELFNPLLAARVG